MSVTSSRTDVFVYLDPDEWAEVLRRDAATGLVSDPKELPPTWLYDDVGCELFDKITRLGEYYPTRAERAVLRAHSTEIASLVRPATLVELGAGTADKTRHLLDALTAPRCLQRYVPFDVAEATTRATVSAIASAYPELEVFGVVGDFRRHLATIPSVGRQLIAFLGGTIGNLGPAERAALFTEVAAAMQPGDAFLLGADLIKDRGRLVAAYDDAAGVTAAFNKNVLCILNRELGANFDVDGFEHVALFNEQHHRIEMHLRARRPVDVLVDGLGLRLTFAAGESIRTEISTKFEPTELENELWAAGLAPHRRWTDPAGDYAVLLAVR